MPIAMHCPGCGGVLHAPDGAEGRKAQCRKCGMMMLVPGMPPVVVEPEVADFEVVEDVPLPRHHEPVRRKQPVEEFKVFNEPPVRRKKTQEEPEVSYDLADDPPVDEDRPKKKKKRRKPKTTGHKVLTGIGTFFGVLIAILIVVAPFIRVFNVIRYRDRVEHPERYYGNNLDNVGRGGPRDVSANWVKFDKHNVSGESPGGPPELDPERWKAMTRGNHTAWMERSRSEGYLYYREDGGRLYFYWLVILGRPPKDDAEREEVYQSCVQASQAGVTMQVLGDATVCGRPGKIVRGTGTNTVAHARMVVVGSTVFVFGVEGEPGMSETDAAVLRFINAFQIKG